MQSAFDRLVSSRKQLIETLSNNGSFAAGLHQLLTDIYPDTAHFVYELLQNAEDVEATKVRFDLSADGCYFAHNGKRNFTIEDIDAITSIGGNLGKKENPTSIGEFGVGFKAVFAYTSTPEIHSGEYHFCIHDFFVPDGDGVSQLSSRYGTPDGWTEFYFPFNSDRKTPEAAFEETLKGLHRLDATSLLFLRHISRIDYSIDGSFERGGYAERCNIDENLLSVSSSKEGEESSVEYLRYTRDIEITSDRGKRKTLPVGVAYLVDSRQGGAIVPLENARVFIYFPADKEQSNLKFHINAPFSATVARDSIRDCEGNRRLIEHVADLVACSLGDIRARGLMGVSFYAVMPNASDALDDLFHPLRDKVLFEFEHGEYLAAKGGGHLCASRALLGSRVFSDLLGMECLQHFVQTERRWIVNPHLKNVSKREEAFLASLPIKRFTEVDFARAFGFEQGRNWLFLFAESQDVSWFRLFYGALLLVYYSYVHGDRDENEQIRRAHNGILSRWFDEMKKAPCVMCSDGVLRRPSEVFLLPPDVEASAVSDPVVASVYVDERERKLGYSPQEVLKLFEVLGVVEWSLRVELERLLKKYSKKVNVKDRGYYRDLITIVRAHEKGIDVDFSEKSLFVAVEPDGKTALKRACEMVIGDEYGNAIGDQVAAFTGFPLLSPIYRKVFIPKNGYSIQDCAAFVEFLKWCGAITGLRISQVDVKRHPKFSSLLDKGRRETHTAEGADFTIDGLPESLNGITYEMSFEIWKLLCANGATPKYAQAHYKPSKSAGGSTCESSLIFHLRKGAWIPDTLGEMHRPDDISFQDIDQGFRSIAEGKLIEALGIGLGISAKRVAERRLESDAAKMGKRLVDEEDYEMLVAWKERKRKAAERNSSKGPIEVRELFKGQDRKERRSTEEGLSLDVGSVSNLPRRAQSIAETIRDRQSLPAIRKEFFSYVYASDKAEREVLRQWYGGKCQICGTVITKVNGQNYFEAINIVRTDDLPDRFRASVDLGWNSLCLCPNCAAKYRYGAKKISSLPGQIESFQIIAGSADPINLEIELVGRIVDVSFVPKHFLALQQGVAILSEGF